jgi:hypothetical protein
MMPRLFSLALCAVLVAAAGSVCTASVAGEQTTRAWGTVFVPGGFGALQRAAALGAPVEDWRTIPLLIELSYKGPEGLRIVRGLTAYAATLRNLQAYGATTSDRRFSLADRVTRGGDASRLLDTLALDVGRDGRVRLKQGDAGGTALYNAILRTLAEVEAGEGRKAVVIFTDGDDRNSTVDPAEVRRAIEASDAVVYFVASGEAARNVLMMQFVGQLAEISGGRVLRASNERELMEAFTEVREEIRNQYLLTYVPARLAKPGTWRPLSVEVSCTGCRVRARTGYVVVAK